MHENLCSLCMVSKSGEIYSKHSHKSIRLLGAQLRQKEVRETFACEHPDYHASRIDFI